MAGVQDVEGKRPGSEKEGTRRKRSEARGIITINEINGVSRSKRMGRIQGEKDGKSPREETLDRQKQQTTCGQSKRHENIFLRGFCLLVLFLGFFGKYSETDSRPKQTTRGFFF